MIRDTDFLMLNETDTKSITNFKNINELGARNYAIPWTTESGINSSDVGIVLKSKPVLKDSRVLASQNGVIESIDDDYIWVKLTEKCVAKFPFAIIQNIKFAKVGSPVSYRVIVDEEGYRTHQIEVMLKNIVGEVHSSIKKILDKI